MKRSCHTSKWDFDSFQGLTFALRVMLHTAMDIKHFDEMSSTQPAKVIFDNYVDGEANMDASDGRLEQIRDCRKFAMLKWNIVNKDYKIVQSALPAPESKDKNATSVLFKLC